MRNLFCCSAKGLGVWRSCCYCHHVSSPFCSLLRKLFPWKWFSFFFFCFILILIPFFLNSLFKNWNCTTTTTTTHHHHPHPPQSVAVANSAARTERASTVGANATDIPTAATAPTNPTAVSLSSSSPSLLFFSLSLNINNTKWGEGGRGGRA